MLRTKKRAPTPFPSPFVIFTFGLVVESIKELGGVSHYDYYFLTCLHLECFACCGWGLGCVVGVGVILLHMGKVFFENGVQFF